MGVALPLSGQGEPADLADPRGGGGTGRERSLRSDHQKPGGATRSQASERYLQRTPFFRYFAESRLRVLSPDSAGSLPRVRFPPPGSGSKRQYPEPSRREES